MVILPAMPKILLRAVQDHRDVATTQILEPGTYPDGYVPAIGDGWDCCRQSPAGHLRVSDRFAIHDDGTVIVHLKCDDNYQHYYDLVLHLEEVHGFVRLLH